MFCLFVHDPFGELLPGYYILPIHIGQIFFPRSLTQELGYTTALIPSTVVDKPLMTTSTDINYGAGSSPMHAPKAIVHPPSVHSSEPSQSEDTTPEYEFEDSANNTRHYSHSHDGHMRIRQTWEQTQDIETDGQYMFDRHSRCLVRPHSDGIAMGLHPYVRQCFFFQSKFLNVAIGSNIPVTDW